MPRQARVVAVGAPHHITQRGNNCQDVFLLDADRYQDVGLLAEHSRQCGLQILGYCLMTNHVHLVAIPSRSDSLANTLRRTHSHYAQSFNQRYGRSGHLWQNRFFSCGLDRDHLVTTLAYVDLNPVRAGMVGSAQGLPLVERAGTRRGEGPARADRFLALASSARAYRLGGVPEPADDARCHAPSQGGNSARCSVGE